MAPFAKLRLDCLLLHFLNARNADFSFKSATKLRPQMVYKLNEKSMI